MLKNTSFYESIIHSVNEGVVVIDEKEKSSGKPKYDQYFKKIKF